MLSVVSSPAAVGQSAAAAAEQPAGFALKAEDFFLLLAAQLRYQNPLEPLDNVQFMNQLTQFAVLQELVELKAEIDKAKEDLQKLQQTITQEEKLGRALSLVGLEVVVGGEGATWTGLVTGVRLVNGVPYLLLGEEAVPLEEIVEVRQPPPKPEAAVPA